MSEQEQPEQEVPEQNAEQTPTKSSRPVFLPRWLIITFLVPIALLFLVGLADRIEIGNKLLSFPGTTLDVEDHIVINGSDSYASPGEIRLVTVRTNFTPSVLELFAGWLDSSSVIRDRSEVLGDRTIEENRVANRLLFDNAEELAVRVALEHLGYDVIVPGGVLIQAVQPATPADGPLEAGDVVVALNESSALSTGELIEMLRSFKPGDLIQLTLEDGEVVNIKLGENEGQAFLGVSISTLADLTDTPFEIDLTTNNIGGPSAGLAISLSVLDSLTPEDLTGGLDVVATGRIFADGTVGTVGGIPQKAHAALRQGADLMLVPNGQVSQAAEVLDGYIPVAGVSSFQEALDALAEHSG